MSAPVACWGNVWFLIHCSSLFNHSQIRAGPAATGSVISNVGGEYSFSLANVGRYKVNGVAQGFTWFPKQNQS